VTTETEGITAIEMIEIKEIDTTTRGIMTEIARTIITNKMMKMPQKKMQKLSA